MYALECVYAHEMTYMHPQVWKRLQISIHACVYIQMRCIHVCVYRCIHIYIYMYVCMGLFVCACECVIACVCASSCAKILVHSACLWMPGASQASSGYAAPSRGHVNVIKSRFRRGESM